VTAPIVVRVATAGDAARLAVLGCATFLESYADLLPAADILAHCEQQHVARVYSNWLADPACRIWLAEHQPGGAPVGYLVLTPPDLPLEGLASTDIEVRRIYLLHRFQRGGSGARLMDAATGFAQEAGCRRLLLGVYSRNAGALEFYRRRGFTQVGTRQFKVGAGVYFDHVLALNL
jgi:ribosomal protein S18 acetylase RimI-like enzyme